MPSHKVGRLWTFQQSEVVQWAREDSGNRTMAQCNASKNWGELLAHVSAVSTKARVQLATARTLNGPCSRQFFDANPSIFHLPAVAFQTDAAGRRNG
jgi:hypothetical protein